MNQGRRTERGQSTRARTTTGAAATPGEPRAPRVPFALLVTGLIGGALVLLLALNTASAANELNRHDLASRDADVSAQMQDLQAQVAASGAPGNLAAAAVALGMVPAGNPAFLVIGANGKVTVLGSAAPATEAPATPIVLPKSAAQRDAEAKAAAAAKAAKAAAAKAKKRGAAPSGSPTTSPSTSRGTSPGAPKSSATPSRPAPSSPSATPTPVITLPGGSR